MSDNSLLNPALYKYFNYYYYIFIIVVVTTNCCAVCVDITIIILIPNL